MKGKWTAIIILILVVRMIVSLAGCGKQDAAKKETKNPTPVVTEKAKTDENPNIKKVDPNSIDKATLDFYKKIASDYQLNEKELREIVAHFLEIGLEPSRIKKIDYHKLASETKGGGEIIINTKPGELKLGDSVMFNINGVAQAAKLENVRINNLFKNIYLYKGKPLHSFNEYILPASKYEEMKKEARIKADVKESKEDYKFVREEVEEPVYYIREPEPDEDNKNEIKFITNYSFFYSREVYGERPQIRMVQCKIVFNKDGKVVDGNVKDFKRL